MKRLAAWLLVLVAPLAAAQTRVSVATDNFNRATLDANWANLHSDWGNVAITGSTSAYGTGGENSDQLRSVARWVGAGSFTDDHYSEIAIKFFSFESAGKAYCVYVRAGAGTNATRSYYQACVQSDSEGPNYTTLLAKVVSGTYTLIHSAAAPWAVDDRLGLEVEGTELRVTKGGTPLGGSFTATDSSLTTGLPGIGGNGGTPFIFDDWDGGNITAGGGGGTIVNPISGRGGAAAQPIF